MTEKRWTLTVNFLPEGEEKEKIEELFKPYAPFEIGMIKKNVSLVSLDSREKCEEAIKALTGVSMGPKNLNVLFADPDENVATVLIEGYTAPPSESEISDIISKYVTPLFINVSFDQRSKKVSILVDMLGKFVKILKKEASEKNIKSADGTITLSVKDSKKRAAPPAPKVKAPSSSPASTPSPAPAPAPAKEEEYNADEFTQAGILSDETVLPVFPAPLKIASRNEINAPEVQAAHMKWLKDHNVSIVTRFPPEPNGFLHIGHAKAMFLDFGLATLENEKRKSGKTVTDDGLPVGGVTYLRYDDTNPKGERQEYIDSIKQTVEKLGYTIWKVTYTSDYFDDLYNFAIDLIKRGLAFIDHHTKAEIKQCKDTMTNSPYRDRSVEENLKLFDRMKKGMCAEGECVLRLKGDMKNANPNMRDPIIYRVIYLPHLRTGDKWCIYPTYDFSHCVCDGLEHITHSLCTLEFEIRRDSYFYLNDLLGVHKPIVWEMSRLNMTHSVMSKRKVNELVKRGLVSGWDDGRLTSLAGLFRRGFGKEILNAFVRRIGFTRNENLIQFEQLEACARRYLNENARRVMAVLEPLKVEILNYEEGREKGTEGTPEFITVPDFPFDPSRGTHQIPFGPVLYIDRSDFREVDAKSFYGLAPGKEVGLKYCYNFKCVEVVKEGDEIVLIKGTIDRERKTKVRGFLQWVAEAKNVTLPEIASSSSSSSSPSPSLALPTPLSSPLTFRACCFEHLFLSENLADSENWLSELNPNSLRVYPDALVDISILTAGKGPLAAGDCFQLERIGFFCVDPDSILSTETAPLAQPNIKLTLNRTVSLRDGDKKTISS